MDLVKWVGLGVLLLLPACSGKDAGDGVVCSSSVGGGSAALDTNGAPTCNATFDNCNDGNTYSVDCPGSTAPCTCALNGSVSRTFDTGDVCGGPIKAIPAIDKACGWDLASMLP